MTDEASFLAAIAENPKDQNLPLVFADWLDEQGDPRGQWIRSPSVRRWMESTEFQSPIPALLQSLVKDKSVVAVRHAAEVIGEPIVPGLTELLKHEKPRVRQQACLCLRKIGRRAKSAVPTLMETLSDSDQVVREHAGKALADIGADKSTSTDRLKAALTDENWNVRRSASKLLGSLGAKRSVLEELVELYESPDVKDRTEVVEGLAQLGTIDVIPHLDKAIDDPASEVRVKAVQALGRLKHAAAVPPLCRAMQSPDANVREAAARPFGGYGHRVPFTNEVIAPLVVLLNDEVARVRATACSALCHARMRVPAAVASLLKNLTHPEPNVRAEAARAIGEVAPDEPAAIPLLVSLIDDELSVSVQALDALAKYSKLPPSVVQPLLDYITHARSAGTWEYQAGTAYLALGKVVPPTPEVIAELRLGLVPPAAGIHSPDLCWQATQAIGLLGPAAVPMIPDLLQVVGDSRLVNVAVESLLKIGPEGAEPLAQLLTGNDAEKKSLILRVMGRVGAAGLPLLPALIRALRRRTSDWSRTQVIQAIQSIGPTATDAIPELLSVIEDAEPNSTQAALSALRHFGTDLVPHLPRLIPLSRSGARTHWHPMFAELFAMLAEHTLDVLDPLRALLRAAMPTGNDAKNWETRWAKERVREEAIRGFSRLKSDAVAAIPDIAPLVADPVENIRREAVRLLGAIGTAVALPPLREALSSMDEVVRLRATEILAEQGDTSDETIATLIHATEDRTPRVRRAAVDALGKLQVNSEAVQAALATALEDHDKKVAERAAIALKKVIPKEPKKSAPKTKGKKKAK